MRSTPVHCMSNGFLLHHGRVCQYFYIMHACIYYSMSLIGVISIAHTYHLSFSHICQRGPRPNLIIFACGMRGCRTNVLPLLVLLF